MTQSERNERYGPGTLACHEVLHMASYFSGAVERELCVHPAIANDPGLLALAHAAAQSLADLYQAIGRTHFAACGDT